MASWVNIVAPPIPPRPISDTPEKDCDATSLTLREVACQVGLMLRHLLRLLARRPTGSIKWLTPHARQGARAEYLLCDKRQCFDKCLGGAF